MRNAVVCLAAVIGFVAVSGCRESVTETKHTAQDDHADMIKELAEGHGIRVGAGTNAEIVVTRTSNTVSVVFTPGLIKRLQPDCLHVLGFTTPEKVLTEQEYAQFLEDFHDYLLLTYGEGHGPKP